jgi:hypothetical protein
MFGFAESDERETMSAGRDRAVGLVETMMTADGLQLAAYGPQVTAIL